MTAPAPKAARSLSAAPLPSTTGIAGARRFAALSLGALLAAAWGLSGVPVGLFVWGALGFSMLCCAGALWQLRGARKPAPATEKLEEAPLAPEPRDLGGENPSRQQGNVDERQAPPAFSIPPVRDDAYEWLGKLGEGQMGEVYKARHKRLGRPCVIKTVRPAEESEVLIGRFKREARVTAGLLSPHTVRVYDFGVRDDGAFFYAMELLDGVDLQKLVRKYGPMPPERAARVLLQVCHSLGEAHQAGLVHRDLKPANVMLCSFGVELDFVKVLDFGLAKDAKEPEEATHLTGGKTVLGTAAYLAPESLRGSATVDSRADLYALGCVAYWLLTARLLFAHDQPVVMAKAHMHEAPPRLRDALPDVPPALDALVALCLQKDPDARPQTAEEIATRLQAMELAPSWTKDRARSWWNNLPPGSAPWREDGGT